MALKREDLTSEQIEKLKKLYWKYRCQQGLAVFLYLGFLFFANFIAVLLDLLYIHKQQFVFFMTLGNAVIAIGGLRGTLDEHRDALVKEVKKITDSK